MPSLFVDGAPDARGRNKSFMEKHGIIPTELLQIKILEYLGAS